jgi:hypothetical protein
MTFGVGCGPTFVTSLFSEALPARHEPFISYNLYSHIQASENFRWFNTVRNHNFNPRNAHGPLYGIKQNMSAQ